MTLWLVHEMQSNTMNKKENVSLDKPAIGSVSGAVKLQN